ncbi:hypothetical protein [Fodinicola feengrottensis]|uniref:Uncharacterized protein n=1 Tax=Fodinicola feengrottensis TaxID=435914 RepID=A0ABN2H2N2_9ACTN|nr:hypothetical protein [Fodinicola feengrottensis]
MKANVPGQRVLVTILVASIVSTALHYTNNYLQIDRYPSLPPITNGQTQVAILVSWPLLTAIGVFGYWLYVRERAWPARACLIIYSFIGLVSLGHFLQGVPAVDWWWLGTIGTDAITALALWAFTYWSISRESADYRHAYAGRSGHSRS